MSTKGNLQVHTQNIFPVIKKWLYSDKDIFLRELVVNGCDAITKVRKLHAAGESDYSRTPRIDVRVDAEAKTITVSDNGIGMTADEVERYITQIAFSGAEEFLEKYKDKDDKSQIIGHFGLGFYSAFMVAEQVTLETKSHTGAPAVLWRCDGGTEYTMEDSAREDAGTTITLHIASDSEDFLLTEKLRSVLLKYCGFLPYEIYLNDEEKSVNDTAPLWTKKPADCTDEAYVSFYHKVFSDMHDPLFWVHLNVDFPFHLQGILYFPKLTHELESAQGRIKLFNNQVYVADNIKEVIPEFLMLLKGVIDSADIPLNVSRSALQNDGTLHKLSAHITKKVADRLIALQKDDRESFDKFWPEISPFIEYGCMNDEKFYDRLKKILQAKTTDGEFVSLTEFAEKNDKSIAYATGEEEQAQYIKLLKEEGKTALIFPHVIDTHFLGFLEMKEQWKFTRIDALPDQTADDEALTALFRKHLGDEALAVTTSPLKTGLPALISQDEQMRRMRDMSKMFGGGMSFPEQHTLVLNSENKLIGALTDMDEEKQALVCRQIYDIARLCGGGLGKDELPGFTERSAALLERLI